MLPHGYSPKFIPQREQTAPGLSVEAQYFRQTKKKMGTEGKGAFGLKLWLHLETSEES